MRENKPFGYHEGAHPLNNIHSFLDKHVMEFPDRPILSWVHPEKLAKWSFDLNDELPHDSVTVKELWHLVGVTAEGLTNQGIEKGDRVIVFIPMSLYLYTAMFALQKIGAVPVFLDSWARRDQMGLSAQVASPKAMISVEKAFVYLNDVKEIASIPTKIVAGPAQGTYSAKLEELMAGQKRAEVTPVEKELTALITFTTGSSGTPKGADRSHRFLAAQHYALNRHLPYQNGDADLPVFPIFSLNNLAAGVTTVIPAIDVGVPNEKDPLVLIAQMKSTGTTCTTLSPSLLNSVSAYCLKNDIKLPFLRRIVTGGAPVSKDDCIRIKKVAPDAEVLVLYGSTEVEPMAHIEADEFINQVSRSQEDAEWVDEGVNVGKMDAGLETRFLAINKSPVTINRADDWNTLLVKRGEVGEIIVAGEHVCERYYNNEEAFAKSKILDENKTVWHRTGDLGRIDEKGDLWIVGRVHNAINRGGTYLFPVRAEIVLKKVPGVKHAAFLGMADEKLGEKTIAAVSLNEGDANEAKAEIARLLAKNEIPVDGIEVLDDIPMDPRHHSKVEYEILRKTLVEKGL